VSNSDFIPAKGADFNLWVNNFFPYMEANADRFGIDPAIVAALHPLLCDWNSKYTIAETPATSTRVTILEKNEARSTLEEQLRPFIKEHLAFNHSVTDGDRRSMELPVYKTTRTPAGLPADAPETWADSSVLRRLTIHFRIAGKRSGAKPKGVHGAEIRWCILNHAPLSIDEMIHSSFDTRSPFTLEFDECDRGKSVYFCVRWENSRGEKGPWSEIVMAIIP
jgi:hypothetical protein